MLQRTSSRCVDDSPAAARETARQAALAYVSDMDPGIRRKRAGRGFCFLGVDGEKIADPQSLARIRALAIPPAWVDVWICANPDGHIQATGRDQRGRKQYRYHPRWSAIRDEAKYSTLVSFAKALPSIRKRIDQDLRKRGLTRERIVASVVRLLDNTMIRVGNASYARDNNSFGLTTLRSRHVAVEGAALRFSFKGKSGKEWKLKLHDRRLAKIIRGVQELPGQNLFQYLDETGERRRVTSQDVNDYIREAAGSEMSSKHFRTWGGTVRAAILLCDTALPTAKGDRTRAMNAVIDQVARHLGNTRKVCRDCYIHPEIIAAWQEGALHREMAMLSRSSRKGLERDEAMVLRWLETRQLASQN